MDAIKKKITLLKEDNETMQEEIERLQEQFHHVYPVITDPLLSYSNGENERSVNLMIRLS